MESSDTTKTMLLFGFGVTALLSAFQVYRLSKRIEEKADDEAKKSKAMNMQETLQTMLMMEMTKRL
jgi:hypothetical protein